MFLGIDLGTSGVKAVLIDADQRSLAEADAPLSVQRPHKGWSEQNPADWLVAVEMAMSQLADRHSLRGVRGIGLSGQMHGATLLNRAGAVLRPCMLWNDTRAHAEAAAMDADPQWREITGNIVFPGFTAPKLAWVRRHEPEVWRELAQVLLPKDYLRKWLTGEVVSDMSDAAGTGWLDVGARDWSDQLLSASGLTRAAMPRLVEGNAVSGRLRPELAERWKMRKSVVVAGGGGDNAATAVGMGVTAPGAAFVSLGTSGVLFATAESFRPAPETAVHSFCHALPATWHQMGVILSCTDALNWYARLVGGEAARLTGALPDTLQPPGETLFLPYLGGERTPHNDAAARGAFVGLGHATDTAAGTRAVLEGVSFAFRDCRDALRATGTEITHLVATGGGSLSTYWLKLLASVLEIPIDLPQGAARGAGFGAARLGMMAATGAGASLATPAPVERTVSPDAQLASAFTEAHERYRRTYAALKEAL